MTNWKYTCTHVFIAMQLCLCIYMFIYIYTGLAVSFDRSRCIATDMRIPGYQMIYSIHI